MEPKLFLVKAVYQSSHLKVCTGVNASLTKRIPTHNGAREYPTPVTFNFCVNDYLYAADTHIPKIHDKFINILLHVDDMIIMADSQIRLRRLLQKLNTYCALHSLNSNKTKFKVMVFSRKSEI